ncbi:MAG TPA: phenylalanine--tRNA ligase subunit beta, partial [Clostridiales bacterium]|nr:phenylalanine--tRNA ligase subunit beta [Clostridiales bacterium]
YGLDGATYCAEIDVVLLHDLEGAEPVYTPLPRFPAITRDIAVVCDAAVPVGELTECIRKAEKNVLRGVKLFDVYTGVGIPEGKKSVAFSLTLRSDDGTLTDDHAEEAVRAVLDALRESFGAVIR